MFLWWYMFRWVAKFNNIRNTLLPSPHVTEQEDQGAHVDQPPLTAINGVV